MTYESLRILYQTGMRTKRTAIKTTRSEIHTTRTILAIRTLRGPAGRRVCIKLLQFLTKINLTMPVPVIPPATVFYQNHNIRHLFFGQTELMESELAEWYQGVFFDKTHPDHAHQNVLKCIWVHSEVILEAGNILFPQLV